MPSHRATEASRIKCPVCGAGQQAPPDGGTPTCRRCRADLGSFLQTRRVVAIHKVAAIAAACGGDRETAAAFGAPLAWLDPTDASAVHTIGHLLSTFSPAPPPVGGHTEHSSNDRGHPTVEPPSDP